MILQCLSSKTTAWNEFSSIMASAIICLAINQKFNFSKYIFESMVKNLERVFGKFLMYPRFIQVFLDKQLEGMSNHKRIHVAPSHTKMIFGNMKRVGKGFSGRETPLFRTNDVHAQTEIGLRKLKRKDTEVPQPSGPTTNVADETVNEEMDDSLERASTTATSLDTKQDRDEGLGEEDASKHGRIDDIDANGDIYLVNVGDQEDASKQGRKINDIDADEDITLENIHDAKMFNVNYLHGDEVFVEKEVPVEEVVSAAEETVTTAIRATIKGIILQEPSESIPTTTTTTTIPSKDKGKGIMVEEPLKMKKKDQISFDEQEAIRLQAEFDEEVRLAREKDEANIALTEEWNDIQAKIETDYELAQRLQAEEQEELTVDEKATLFQQLLEKRRKHFAAKRAEEKRNRPPTRAQQRSIMCTYLKNMAGWKPKDLKSKSFANIQELFDKAFKRVNTFVDFRTELVEGTKMEESSKKAELEQENAKKQKVDDDQEAAKMKELMKIIPDEEEVAVDAIPLATKPPSIVDWKIVKEGKISYYQIIRADGSSKRYSAFIQMLRSFDREDLETLWKLVKAKHGYTRPEEGYERVLWGDLKIMFEHHVEDAV
ncbi:hypothetical protein Tco_0751387 [Tanacetum coccineum]|uniref:Uncharacterized protein n=1 Tax=Tanacetum coccineum TaxID=301880 RepID=A0ABQ4Z530_9ASTR